jgi:hypothetical protein
MQDMKIYILIEGQEKESEVRIDGNLETLRELLNKLRVELFPSAPVAALPVKDPKQNEGGTHVTA